MARYTIRCNTSDRLFGDLIIDAVDLRDAKEACEYRWGDVAGHSLSVSDTNGNLLTERPAGSHRWIDAA